MITAKIEGLSELDRALQEFPLKVQKNAISAMLYAGAAVVRNEARTNFDRVAKTQGLDEYGPKHPKSRPGIKIFRRRYRIAADATMTVSALGSYPSYFMETGTKSHVISVKKAFSVLANKRTGQIFGSSVKHPGQMAKPWLAPAFDNNIERIVNRMKERLEAYIATIRGRI